ncbi:13965_t:CDS:1, partial [Gigaspora margarita]
YYLYAAICAALQSAALNTNKTTAAGSILALSKNEKENKKTTN